MLGLAGMPGTVGFMGKLYLIEAAVGGDYTWLGVMIVIGSMISLGYYLRVIAAMWMKPAPRLRPAIAGGSPEADEEDAEDAPDTTADIARPGEVHPGLTPAGTPSGGRCALVIGAMLIAAGASVFFGVFPSPLVDFAQHAGEALAVAIG